METPIRADGDAPATTNFLLGLRRGLAPLQQRGDEERQLADHCAMGALAVPLHLAAAEARAARFARWYKAPAAQRHGLEDNQALFDFFTHADAAVESFCFAAYCFGALVRRADFPLHQTPGQIQPAAILEGYQAVAPGERFTECLAVLLNAPAYQEIAALRGLLSRRLTPPQEIVLKGWQLGPDGLASKPLVLDLETLSAYFTWLEAELSVLAEDLDAYAQSQGV
jgi:hypothetical protein